MEKIKKYNKENSVLILGSHFEDKGGWAIDQNFALQMGSTYVLAHGMGIPVADARTSVKIPSEGEYNLFVRTRDWTKYWSKGSSAGLFRICLDNRELTTTFGNEDVEWSWQAGEKLTLSAVDHIIALHDLTGFDGRCDAILLTKIDETPDKSLETYRELRKELAGLPPTPNDGGLFDFVVVGGGYGGMCAAVAAARLGSKVALIQDRRMLGGNNSSEVRVGLGGRINIGKYPSLGYLCNEIGPEHKGNSREKEIYEDDRKLKVILSENNIQLFLGYQVRDVRMSANDTIESVFATEIETDEVIEIKGRLFSDCTGDANLAVMAGAQTLMGREASHEFDEPTAPEMADDMTMGASIMWYCIDAGKPKPFPTIDWGLTLNEENVEVVHRGQWYWETGMNANEDQIKDAEKIRDYGMYVAFSNWEYLKNRYSKKGEYCNFKLGWVSFLAGKRDSRRIIGDYILREKDVMGNVRFEDGTVATTWCVDIHFPDPKNSKYFPGQEYMSTAILKEVPLFAVPYRCFYSRDIKNMFMAGRNISVSHVTLGTIRVMRTIAMIGEVVGMAADICRQKKAFPRDVYTSYLEELKVLMRKGIGRTDVQYNQFYTLLELSASHREDN